MRYALFVLVIVVAAAGALAAGEPAPTFTLVKVDGRTIRGTLDKLSAGAVRLVDGERLPTAKAGQWLTFRRDGAKLPPHPTGEQVVLASGERLPLAPKSMLLAARERLFFRPAAPLKPGAVEFSPPLAQVALVWLAAPDGEDAGQLLRRLLSEPRKRDLVLLRDGDRVEGAVTALNREDACRVRVGKRDVEIPFARVAAVAYRTDLLAAPAPGRAFYHVVLENGCRLTLAEAGADFRKPLLSGKTLYGEPVQLPLSAVAALEVRGGPAVYLSELEPKRYEHTPYLGVAWPLAKDGTSAGRDLLLGGDTFDRGIGMHASSRLTYDLGGKYRRFEALVGLDPREGRRGRAAVSVLVDGEARECGLPKELTAADRPVAVSLDVKGARELTLVVGFGRGGDVQAHAAWAGARLVK